MANVSFKSAQRWYAGTGQPAVPGIDLDILDGEFVVLVGPSGCGKSTTLRMLAGLEPVDDGQIFVGDRDVTRVAPKSRDIAMVFQSYALYPHMNVEENMGFGLKIAGVPKAERTSRVREAARILGLTDYLSRKPKALSGGQRQRVAMGRAIVRRPQVFCMDEPLSNLDAKMRVATRTDIARLQRELGVTTVYVTHDQVEAMTMGDRVAVMKDGEIQQFDTPLNLYDKPANEFVAGFIGSPQMNLLPGVGVDREVLIGNCAVPVLGAPAGVVCGPVTVGVRPESWLTVGNQERGLPLEILVVEELGADSFAYGTADVAGVPLSIVVRAGGRGSIVPGQTIRIVPVPERVHLFDIGSGARIN